MYISKAKLAKICICLDSYRFIKPTARVNVINPQIKDLHFLVITNRLTSGSLGTVNDPQGEARGWVRGGVDSQVILRLIQSLN